MRGKKCGNYALSPLLKFLAMPQPALVVGEENLVIGFGPPTLEMLPPSLSVAYLFRQHGKKEYLRDHYENLRDHFGFSQRFNKTLVVGTSFHTEKLITSRPVDITIQRQSLLVR